MTAGRNPRHAYIKSVVPFPLQGLLNLKDKSKKESFKPFDRSFLLKKRVCGSDLFKGDRQTYLGKDSVVFEKLWTADELEFGEYRSSLVCLDGTIYTSNH